MSPDAKAAMDAWLESVGPASQPDGFTSAQLQESWGVSHNTTMMRMKTLANAGRLKFVGKRRTTRIDGRLDSVPVYQLVKKPAAVRGR